MPESNTTSEKTNLTILLFCVVKLCEIISILREHLVYSNTESLQMLKTYYIYIHREMTRLFEAVSESDSDINEFVNTLRKSGLLENKTLIGYEDLALHGLLNGEFEEKLNHVIDKLRHVSIVHSAHFPQPPSFYMLENTGKIREVDYETIEGVKDKLDLPHLSEEEIKKVMDSVETATSAMDINKIIQGWISVYHGEMELLERDNLSIKKKGMLFEINSGKITLNGVKIGNLTPGTQIFSFFNVLYENIENYVSYEKIIEKISSIDQKSRDSIGKSSFCANIKRKLPKEINNHIHSSKLGYMLSVGKTK